MSSLFIIIYNIFQYFSIYVLMTTKFFIKTIVTICIKIFLCESNLNSFKLFLVIYFQLILNYSIKEGIDL